MNLHGTLRLHQLRITLSLRPVVAGKKAEQEFMLARLPISPLPGITYVSKSERLSKNENSMHPFGCERLRFLSLIWPFGLER